MSDPYVTAHKGFKADQPLPSAPVESSVPDESLASPVQVIEPEAPTFDAGESDFEQEEEFEAESQGEPEAEVEDESEDETDEEEPEENDSDGSQPVEDDESEEEEDDQENSLDEGGE